MGLNRNCDAALKLPPFPAVESSICMAPAAEDSDSYNGSERFRDENYFCQAMAHL
jgi:hypothetical protein